MSIFQKSKTFLEKTCIFCSVSIMQWKPKNEQKKYDDIFFVKKFRHFFISIFPYIGNKKNAKFNCFECNFSCDKNSIWGSHLQTKKHTAKHFWKKMEIMEMPKNAENICNCGKIYSSVSGLWKHKTKCDGYAVTNINIRNVIKEVVIEK